MRLKYQILQLDNGLLRKMTKDDIDEIYTIRSHPLYHAYSDTVVDQDREHTMNFIDEMNCGIDDGKWLVWCYETNEKEIVGIFSLWHLSLDGKEAEIGFGTHPNYFRKGYGKKAIDRILLYAFNDIGIEVIHAWTEQRNEASCTLLNQLHFHAEQVHSFDGFHKKQKFYMKRYSISKDQYLIYNHN